MCRPGLPKDRQEQGSEQCQGKVEEGLLRGHTGANPEVPVHQTGATAINTQQNGHSNESVPGLQYGPLSAAGPLPGFMWCLLLLPVLQVLPCPQQQQVSGKNLNRKEGRRRNLFVATPFDPKR